MSVIQSSSDSSSSQLRNRESKDKTKWQCLSGDSVKQMIGAFSVMRMVLSIAVLVGGVKSSQVTSQLPATVLDDLHHEYDSTLHFLECGSIGCIAALFGLLGSYKNRKWIFVIFEIQLLILNPLTIFLAVRVIHLYRIPEETLKAAFEKSVSIYDSDSKAQSAWDDFQEREKCCGLSGPDDWREVHIVIPDTCYPSKSRKPFSRGCFGLGINQVRAFSICMVVIDIVDGCLQLACIVLSPYLMWTMRKHARLLTIDEALALPFPGFETRQLQKDVFQDSLDSAVDDWNHEESLYTIKSPSEMTTNEMTSSYNLRMNLESS